MTKAPAPPQLLTLADLVEHLGGIPAARIRLRPHPGTAREEDVVRVYELEKRLCELVDGVLVEKAMGFVESYLANLLSRKVGNYLDQHDLGIVTGADGLHRLAPGLIRLPDAAFVSWDRLPGGLIPGDAIVDIVPDLAIEVVSRSNSRAEIKRKLREYFEAGVRVAWVLNPRKRVLEVYTAPEDPVRLHERDVLDGGEVLPGFRLPLEEVFKRVGGPRGRGPGPPRPIGDRLAHRAAARRAPLRGRKGP
ncbi:MAG: Uma2 family endonuclease [Planctomycetes bacterium]|nr:Uma2 family endonuclease [Planctomycetota bacterium]